MMSLWYDFWNWITPSGPVPAQLALSDCTPALASLFDGAAVLTLSDSILDTMGLTDQ